MLKLCLGIELQLEYFSSITFFKNSVSRFIFFEKNPILNGKNPASPGLLS
jgi:hypothetical protein